MGLTEAWGVLSGTNVEWDGTSWASGRVANMAQPQSVAACSVQLPHRSSSIIIAVPQKNIAPSSTIITFGTFCKFHDRTISGTWRERGLEVLQCPFANSWPISRALCE